MPRFPITKLTGSGYRVLEQGQVPYDAANQKILSRAQELHATEYSYHL
jgi:hypothetical protein